MTPIYDAAVMVLSAWREGWFDEVTAAEILAEAIDSTVDLAATLLGATERAQARQAAEPGDDGMWS